MGLLNLNSCLISPVSCSLYLPNFHAPVSLICMNMVIQIMLKCIVLGKKKTNKIQDETLFCLAGLISSDFNVGNPMQGVQNETI